MLRPGLSQLPLSFQEPAVLQLLSVDAQVYLQCNKCDWETRLSLLELKNDKPPARLPCGKCSSKGGKTVVRHLMTAHVTCKDFGHTSQINLTPWDDQPQCPQCQSHDVDLADIAVAPPFPTRFGWAATDTSRSMSGLVRKDFTHSWGLNGVRDARLLRNESRWCVEMLPDAASYLLTLILFMDRLRQFSEYQTWEDKYYITNIEANTCQDYVRKTGSIQYGLMGLELFGEMAGLPPDEPNRAIAEHSYAMGAYTLLSMFGEDYVAAVTQRPKIRLEALVIAMHAEEVFVKWSKDNKDSVDAERFAQQIARIRWVMADLLRIGNSDDKQRTMAIGYFSQALEDESLSKTKGFAIRGARAETIMELQNPDEDQIREAVKDLGEAANATGSDEAYANRWRPTFLLARFLCRNGEWRESIPYIQEAASLALQRFRGFLNEELLRHEAEVYVPVFELLATVYTDVGWSDEALAAVEITRGATVRLYSMLSADRKRNVDEIMARFQEDLVPVSLKDAGMDLLSPQTSKRHIDDYFEKNPVGSAVMSVLKRVGGRAAFICLVLTENVATALICRMVGKDKWQVERKMWKPAPGSEELLRKQLYVQQGPFRERLLNRACNVAYETLLQPFEKILREFEVDHCIFSVPGLFSRLPFEAMGAKDTSPLFHDPTITVSYLPSLRMGADLVGRSKAKRDRASSEVLVVGYEGEDMPRQKEEVAKLRSIWGDRLKFMPGKDCTKGSVLKELSELYDIVHILCHGTFDDARPLDSALYFCADREKDSRRITAMDILTRLRLSNQPLVILSACSSAMTEDSRTNSFHGLCGSLFRVGARGIVGSRWPVGDAAAAIVMADFHERLAHSTDAPERCLDRARRAQRQAGRPVEDWAAFGYFGIP